MLKEIGLIKMEKNDRLSNSKKAEFFIKWRKIRKMALALKTGRGHIVTCRDGDEWSSHFEFDPGISFIDIKLEDEQ